MTLHDYRCQGACHGCGGGGLPGAVCPYCQNSGKCEGACVKPDAEGIVLPEELLGWFEGVAEVAEGSRTKGFGLQFEADLRKVLGDGPPS